MKNKQQQIKEKSAKPFEVGDYVGINYPYVDKVRVQVGKGKNKEWVTNDVNKIHETQGTIFAESLTNDGFYIKCTNGFPHGCGVTSKYGLDGDMRQSFYLVAKEFLSPTFLECGNNPFGRDRAKISFFNQSIWSLLFKAGYGRKSDVYGEPEMLSEGMGYLNLDPHIIDVNGERQYYQRGLVWTLEQKQLLIDSIYQGIEIGKFLLRKHNWEKMDSYRIIYGKGWSHDLVDGKQRITTIISFIKNEFQDSYGNYWDDLSSTAQRKFFDFDRLAYGEIDGHGTDLDVQDCFLTLNFTGTPMSQKHIDFVKSINLKK